MRGLERCCLGLKRIGTVRLSARFADPGPVEEALTRIQVAPFRACACIGSSGTVQFQLIQVLVHGFASMSWAVQFLSVSGV